MKKNNDKIKWDRFEQQPNTSHEKINVVINMNSSMEHLSREKWGVGR